MRGVADQSEPLADEFARGVQPKRKGTRLGRHCKIAEMQAEALFQLVMEFRIRQREDALCFFCGFGPYDGNAFSREWQDCKRPGRHEVFLGAAIVLALMRDRADDGRLIVIPAKRRNPGGLAYLRARAVRANQKRR